MKGLQTSSSLKRGKKCECLILLRLHNLALSGTLVVNAAEVENAVDDDAVEFLFVGGTYVLGIRTHGVEGDKEVAADFIALRVVKGNDVRIIIVLEELAVDLQNLFIVHKDVGNGATTLAVRLCHGVYPSSGGRLVDIGEGEVDAVVGNHLGFEGKGCKVLRPDGALPLFRGGGDRLAVRGC